MTAARVEEVDHAEVIDVVVETHVRNADGTLGKLLSRETRYGVSCTCSWLYVAEDKHNAETQAFAENAWHRSTR